MGVVMVSRARFGNKFTHYIPRRYRGELSGNVEPLACRANAPLYQKPLVLTPSAVVKRDFSYLPSPGGYCKIHASSFPDQGVISDNGPKRGVAWLERGKISVSYPTNTASTSFTTLTRRTI